LPESSKDALVSKRNFTTKVAGRTVTFRLAYGRDDQRLEQLLEQYPDKPATCQLEPRIVSVSGETPEAPVLDRKSTVSVLDWLRGLDAGDADDLRVAFDEVDCGVEVDIDIDCPKCDSPSTVQLPFEEFFSTVRSRRRQRRSTLKARKTLDVAEGSNG
jgi:hypothetical protein